VGDADCQGNIISPTVLNIPLGVGGASAMATKRPPCVKRSADANADIEYKAVSHTHRYPDHSRVVRQENDRRSDRSGCWWISASPGHGIAMDIKFTVAELPNGGQIGCCFAATSI
jgi:hypothetical protein